VSVASDLALEVSSRLSAITVANGYATDIGLSVKRGKRRLAIEDVPVLVLLEGDDRAEARTRRTAKLAQQYTAEGHMECADPDNPNDTAHLMLADIKRAVFSGDYRFENRVAELNYIGRAIGAREDGTNICFASVTFELVFSEDLTAP
jgi:hypothetical protein